jgi:hypothetical protein
MHGINYKPAKVTDIVRKYYLKIKNLLKPLKRLFSKPSHGLNQLPNTRINPLE